MTVLIIVVAVLASVLVEIFRYRSMKKEDPKTTLGSVLSNGAEQLLIIFLSAIVALYIANSSEEKKMKDQIIKVLDVVQSEMEGKLSSYKKAVSGEYYVNLNNKDMDPELYDKLFAEILHVRGMRQ